MKITVGGKEFDLSNAIPLKVREWKALEKQGVKLGSQDENSRVTTMAMIAQAVLKKADPSIPDDFVDDLTIEECAKVAAAPTKAEAQSLDRPT